MVLTTLCMSYVSASHFFFKHYFCHVSRQYRVTSQVSIVTRVKLLSKYQFGPYICYFDTISVSN